MGIMLLYDLLWKAWIRLTIRKWQASIMSIGCSHVVARGRGQLVVQVIYCADARTTLTVDVKRVCEDGVLTASKALQVRSKLQP